MALESQLRALRREAVDTGYFDGGWDQFRSYVAAGAGIHTSAVFHGFSSIEEAQCYWAAAGRLQPWPELRAQA